MEQGTASGPVRTLPVGSFDLGVDVIVTEIETIRCAPGFDGPPTSQT